MINNKFLIPVSDIYFISEQIKRINSAFCLFYNTQFNRYEIHNTLVSPSFVISFSHYPDYRVIEKIYKTNKENMSILFKEIDEHNKKLDLKHSEQILDKSACQINEIFEFINKNPSASLEHLTLKNILEKED